MGSRSKSKCPITRESCPEHLYEHGAEAEELRAGIEGILEGPWDSSTRQELQDLTDRVDARDSLAWSERKKKRKTPSPINLSRTLAVEEIRAFVQWRAAIATAIAVGARESNPRSDLAYQRAMGRVETRMRTLKKAVRKHLGAKDM